MKRILIIDDDLDLCTLLSNFLKKKGFETDMAFSGNKGIAKFKEGNFDMVLCDYRLGDKDGRDVLREIKSIKPSVIVIIITGYSDIKTAVDVIKQGAFDYISKPLIHEEVMAVINNAFSKSTDVEEPVPIAGIRKESKKSMGDEFLVGNDPTTHQLHQQIKLVAPTNYSVIIYGESGTGKEVVAKTIHNHSDRRDRPFIALDCGTLSKELAGSELFGHMKGSFTGALGDKEGHFELANGGTLFLDEVANLSVDIQAALLRVIQERKFKRVGGVKEMPVDIRIIVASNENLQQSYKKGRFREDLFHRFNEFSISLPPLRNRRLDIPLFAEFFLQKANNELQKNIAGFSDEVMNTFIHYNWPGNLREFRNVVRRTALLTTGDVIDISTLPPEMINGDPDPELSLAFPEARRQPESMNFDTMNLKDAALKAERETILSLLKKVKYNKTKAAKILNIDRKTLYNKMKSFGIDEQFEQ